MERRVGKRSNVIGERPRWPAWALVGLVASCGGNDARIGTRRSGLTYLQDYSATGTPPAVTLPGAGGSYTDPVFGTQIIRVTNNIGSGSPGTINSNYAGSCANAYGYWNAFNSDDSRLLIACNNWLLVYDFDTTTDSVTFASELRNGTSTQLEGDGASWSSSSPNQLYALGTPTGTTPPRILYRVDVSQTGAGRFTAVHDFTSDLNSVYSGFDSNWQLDQLSKSDDDTVFSFMVRGSGGVIEPWGDIIVYNATTGAVSIWPKPGGDEPDESIIDKGGEHVVIPPHNASPWAIWNLDTGSTDFLSGSGDRIGGHYDPGATYLVNDDGYESGVVRRTYGSGVHSPVNIFKYYTDNTHSNANFCIPDHESFRDDSGQYVAVSTYMQSLCTGSGCTSCSLSYSVPFANEIFLVKSDGSGFYRLAHTRSTTISCDDGEPTGNCYEHQVRASVDRFAHYVIFHSDMGSGGTGFTGTTDVFIAKIPSALWPSTGGCTAPLSACAGESGCFDTTSDPAHCGTSCAACPATASCTSSVCVCPTGQTLCSASNSCIDTTQDVANCGSCGHACSAGQACAASVCVTPTTHRVTGDDFNGDQKGDFLTRDASGNMQVWTSGGTVESSTASLSSYYTDSAGWNNASRIFAMDFDGDGKTDLLARGYNGGFDVDLSNGSAPLLNHGFTTTLSDVNGWNAVNRLFPADVNGDGKWDLVARQTDGTFQLWLSNGSILTNAGSFTTSYTDTAGYGAGNRFYFLDVNGDSKSDFIVRGANGSFDVWTSNGTTYSNTSGITASYSDSAGYATGNYFLMGDLDGDHRGDMLVRHSDGTFDVWISNGTNLTMSTSFTSYFTDTGGAGSGNRFVMADVNGDGKTDMLFRYANGTFEEWFSNGSTLASAHTFTTGFTDTAGWNSGIRFY
jgi:hypothetical protein